MPKKQKIKYNYSGKWEDVNHLLRLFSTKDVLASVNNESEKLISSTMSSNIPAAERVSYIVYNERGQSPKKRALCSTECRISSNN